MADRTGIGIRILEHEYGAFKALMPNDERLGASYKEWKKAAAGHPPAASIVTVHPEEFRLYCLQIGQTPSYYVLEAFAVKKTRDPAGSAAS